MEKRTFNTEMRKDGEYIEGIASSVNSRYDMGWFEEEIAPGAFDDVMSDDVRVLFNHDMNMVLGRTKSKTAEIFKTREGHLGYRYKTPERSFAKDVEDMVRTGDIDQSSFAFRIKEEKWTWREDRGGDKDLRTILKIERLYDVSPVTYPANPDTSVSMNSKKQWEEARSAHEQELKREQIKEGLQDNEDITGHSGFEDNGQGVQEVTRSNEIYKRKLTLLKL